MSINNRNTTTGRFVRSPVSAERFWNRVSQLAGGLTMRSMAEAERMAAQELRLALIFDDGGVVDWYERSRA